MKSVASLSISVSFALLSVGCITTTARPPYAPPVAPPLAQDNCALTPPAVQFYGGLSLADVERAGKFPMQHPEPRYLDLATSSVWARFKVDLLPTDIVYEYYHDERWEGGRMYHGGLAAFRGGCTVKLEQVWTT